MVLFPGKKHGTMNIHLIFPVHLFVQKLAEKFRNAYLLLFSFGFLLFSCAGSRSLRPVDETGLQRLLERSRGKVVLLNFWATWCEPCVEEFPDLMKIAREFRPRGLEIFLVSIDDPEEIAQKVAPFLQSQKVSFRTYLKKTRDDEVFINSIDRTWSGAIPATFIYDREGVLVKKFIARQDYRAFAEVLQPLLSKPVYSPSQ
jgi:thiol-disulfide isomerase/thioredoxin